MGIFNNRMNCALKAREVGPVLTTWSYNLNTGECFGSLSFLDKLWEHACDTSTNTNKKFAAFFVQL